MSDLKIIVNAGTTVESPRWLPYRSVSFPNWPGTQREIPGTAQIESVVFRFLHGIGRKHRVLAKTDDPSFAKINEEESLAADGGKTRIELTVQGKNYRIYHTEQK